LVRNAKNPHHTSVLHNDYMRVKGAHRVNYDNIKGWAGREYGAHVGTIFMTALHIYYLRVPPKVLASKFSIYYDKVFLMVRYFLRIEWQSTCQQPRAGSYVSTLEWVH
jgi:hypothetical protein